MKFALASYGTRGDIEPSTAVGRELQRRGHEVRLAVPPNLVDLVEAAGLDVVPYGPDQQQGFWDVDFLRKFWKVRQVLDSWRQTQDLLQVSLGEMSATLVALADGADLLFTGPGFPQVPANVAEYYGIPLAAMHYFPMLPNGQLAPNVPAPLVRTAMTLLDWPQRVVTKRAEDAQRRELGLPKATGPAPRRISARGSLEIQAYDQVVFPGLADEWAKWRDQRPFVGTLTIAMSTEADEDVAAWIAAGTPPIFFGFGSTAVKSPAQTIEMIGSACARLGERALVGSGGSDFSTVPHFDHVKVVGPVNYATVFPACRAVVHHSGAGTTAAGLRAGVPTLSLWSLGDQRIWAGQVKRLQVGTARPFSATTQETLVGDLREILAPDCVDRARDIATRMTNPAESAAKTADLLENFARMPATNN
ncbi:glycosyltransferase [Mycobacterium montefiorense]|uniref:Glycosyltransferase GtfA n=1 Tax=Mycobacterium montefiorense TaxID=154654 RepID=A0AA37PJD1_9MYCO|nr:glycosyltransferase [Mycobacterium montefiorense]GBG38480.1 glycosyltransferase GtfA [Mycobacterium montefiorense]GKU34308.1 glycosyltransferase GtfA [Mycobacterium montefiorense]GKU38929.1 glycosyltransferase GtfA [Mycobacterium montefiorense]GKU48036.1 glycosyltransferase GtfA [Mycobacterium montefiorense]GKU49693.1 glycosyltransferase GtfA [Mycobacterium montefiorense]